VTPPVLLVATRSAGKLRELRSLVAEAGFRARSLDEALIAATPEEERLEAFDTFEENARAKARFFLARSGGVPVLAEDSGLVVEALGGAPGVRSKRWSASPLSGPALDEANNRALLDALATGTDRRAKYVCVAVLAFPGGEVCARGESAGRILRAPCGTNGFGYDPLFLSDELAITFAEAAPEEKARVSHRGRAVRVVLAAFALRAQGLSAPRGR